MNEYAVWYSGMIVDYVRATGLDAAKELATKLFSSPVVVTSMDATAEEIAAAKAAS